MITPCSQRTLMDSPLVMKMCTNLSLLYYYSIDQRLVMDRVQAQFSPPRYLPNNTTFLPFWAGPRAHPRAEWENFEPSLPKDHYYDILYMTGVRKKNYPRDPFVIFKAFKRKKSKILIICLLIFLLSEIVPNKNDY